MKERRSSGTAGQEQPAPSGAIDRRSFVRTATVGGATAAALAAAGGLSTSALAATNGPASHSSNDSAPTLMDAGAGMHSGMSTVQMMGIATISKELTTCAVGQFGLTLSELLVLGSFLEPYLGILLGEGWSGPFAMEMYSLNVKSYDINRTSGVLTAKGVVRSITKIAGVMIENATSPYIAVGTDGRGQPDSYYLSFTTPFWATPGNPLATPSTFHKGWSMFGGELIVGEVSVPK
ncbi:MAG: hypothetical protein ACRDNF_15200 [Streptosporangiaceae bacterium]